MRLEHVDWNARYVSRLWTYNLHYFEYGVDLAWAYRMTGEERFVRRFERLVVSWIESVTDRRGDGWDPYPLSTRVVNWAWALLLLGDALGPEVRDAVARSLYSQAAFLDRHLEWDVLANHLLRNLSGLLVGGLLFEGSRAARWTRRATALLRREVLEQVLPDGFHFERSPMYHAIVLADLLQGLSLLRAAGEPVPPAVSERIAAMARALGVFVRPNGELHLFNDCANGVAPPVAWLHDLAGRTLGVGIDAPAGPWSLRDAGYFGYRSGGDALIVDCGNPGPTYQAGHAHCDLLSFELDVAGRPIVVDAGVHGYDSDPYREYVRSTRAHNTVTIGGKEQSEVWGTFRLARRAEVVGQPVLTASDGASFVFRGAYRPYHDRRAAHRREMASQRGMTTVTDRVDGAEGAELISYLHFHPDLQVVLDGHRATARAREVSVRIEPFGCDALRLASGERSPVQGWHCPEFGRALAAPVLEMRVSGNHGGEFGYRLIHVR
jgi:uncharacterized heparinase superfamily protein